MEKVIVKQAEVIEEGSTKTTVIEEKEIKLTEGGKKLQLPAIKSLEQVIGLDKCTDLEFLMIGMGQLEELKGLDALVNLKKLYVGNQRLTEIKGLEKLVNLEVLKLEQNGIEEIKGLEMLVRNIDPQRIAVCRAKGLAVHAIH